MKRAFVVGATLSLLLANVGVPPSSRVAGAATQTLQGSLQGAPYIIKMPDNWNGALIVHAPTFKYAGGDRIPSAFFNNPIWSGADAASLLLARGYALAGTAYQSNGFVAAIEGRDDVKRLTRFFIRKFSKPRRTILSGEFAGSVVALKLLEEKGPMLFDGAVSGCSIGPGLTAFVDRMLDYNLAFEGGFQAQGGFPPSWGTAQLPNPLTDFDGDVIPTLQSLLSSKYNFGSFEFQRLVQSLSVENYYTFDAPGADITLFMDTHFSLIAIGDLNYRAGGPVTQNVGRQYELIDYYKYYLGSLGYDADSALSYMNTHRFVADENPRAYVKQVGDYTGNIRRPVLMLHTQNDGLTAPEGTSGYKVINERAGRQALLDVVYTVGSGQCNFSQDQLIDSILAMDSWIKTGAKPDSSFFPQDHGFTPPDWTPGPWFYPIP